MEAGVFPHAAWNDNPSNTDETSTDWRPTCLIYEEDFAFFGHYRLKWSYFNRQKAISLTRSHHPFKSDDTQGHRRHRRCFRVQEPRLMKRDDRGWTGKSCLSDSPFCQAMCFYSGQTGRQADCSREADCGVGGGVLSTQESTCSALWECLDISSNSSAWEKKENHLLCFGCSRLELKGWPQFDISKHRSCKYMKGDKLDSAALISLFSICTPS